MPLEDKDFIEKQVETAAKGLGQFFDLDELNQLFKKKKENEIENLDDEE